MQEGNDQPYNYIIYNDSKFEVIHDDTFPKTFDSSLEKLGLANRARLAVLQYIGSDSALWYPRIVVVSFHNHFHKLPDNEIQSYATKFFSALNDLGEVTGCPVLVGGDFNCELLNLKAKEANDKKIYTQNFTIPKYDPTMHRALIGKGRSNPCIDFLAYKNYSDTSGCTEIELDNVHAEIVLPRGACLVKGTDGQCHLDYKEHKYITNRGKADSSSTLKELHSLSNHDPLRATLNIKFKNPQKFIMSYYNVNNDQNVIKRFINYTHVHDLYIFHDIDASNAKHQIIGYELIKMSEVIVIFCKKLKF